MSQRPGRQREHLRLPARARTLELHCPRTSLALPRGRPLLARRVSILLTRGAAHLLDGWRCELRSRLSAKAARGRAQGTHGVLSAGAAALANRLPECTRSLRVAAADLCRRRSPFAACCCCCCCCCSCSCCCSCCCVTSGCVVLLCQLFVAHVALTLLAGATRARAFDNHLRPRRWLTACTGLSALVAVIPSVHAAASTRDGGDGAAGARAGVGCAAFFGRTAQVGRCLHLAVAVVARRRADHGHDVWILLALTVVSPIDAIRLLVVAADGAVRCSIVSFRLLIRRRLADAASDRAVSPIGQRS